MTEIVVDAVFTFGSLIIVFFLLRAYVRDEVRQQIRKESLLQLAQRGQQPAAKNPRMYVQPIEWNVTYEPEHIDDLRRRRNETTGDHL